MAGIIKGIWSNSHSVSDATGDHFSYWITPDGLPAPGSGTGFKAEAGRYHFYLAHGCPNSHRVLITKRLLGMDNYFTATFVHDIKRLKGWEIDPGMEPLFGASSLHDVMIQAEGNITAKSTVPLLLDRQAKRVVSAMSADMVRMIANIHTAQPRAFKTELKAQLWPDSHSNEIDQLNQWMSHTINSAVYRVLFAVDSETKQTEIAGVRQALQKIDERLRDRPYLHGNELTASDVWLFPTLLRFDTVYAEIFGLDFTLSHFTELEQYLERLWSIPTFASVSQMDNIQHHYYGSYIHGPHGVLEPGKGRSPPRHNRAAPPS